MYSAYKEHCPSKEIGISHRKLARLLVLVGLLWIVSNVVLIVQPQITSGVIAALAPTATPQGKLRSPSTLSQVYLPVVLCDDCPPAPPPAPAMTTSRYFATTNLIQMQTAGCNQGLAGETGIVILDFGYPYYDSTSQNYGTKLLLLGNPFVGGWTIENLAWEFIHGWVTCAPADKTLEVAIGLNNSPNFWQLTAAHGTFWAETVSDLAYLVSHDSSTMYRVSVAGAMDIEFQWNTAANTRPWVDAFDPGWLAPFYNFGSCDSCPWFEHTNWTPHDFGWEMEDIYYISTRISDHGTVYLPFPQIYKRNRQHADQWYRVSLYGLNTHNNALNFRGTLTQYYACHEYDNWDDCYPANTYNTPEEGWTQLWQALNANFFTSLGAPVVSSDIRWYVTNVR
ncbi:MAG: hypothetical protein HZB51_27090 [Chloroflexi bacterium]|nr:hypothetical protein [Chloroflexota bacterium]